MSTHQFLVTVEIENWPDDVPVYEDQVVRLPEWLAQEAAWRGGIYQVNNIDGWADFPKDVKANVTEVEEYE
jgi:hypothetical protein